MLRQTSQNRGIAPFRPETALLKSNMYPTIPLTNIPNTSRSIGESPEYLKEELDTEVLNNLRRLLWMAGLPANKIRPLHRHRVLNRDIVVCEQTGLHLVSFRNKIFVKPIPRCLLHHNFYSMQIAPDQMLSSQALGFLSSYLRIVRYESDFAIALELGLVPSTTTWQDWLLFAQDVESCALRTYGNRFDYGELRLSRLNIIVRFQLGHFTRGYQSLESSYGSYFTPFFGLIILIFGFISLALSAFQVMQGAPSASPVVFSVGYGFSVATLIVLGVVVVLPAVWFFVLFLDNAAFALCRRH